MRTKSNSEKNITIRIKNSIPWRLTSVKPLANYSLEVVFVDGTHGLVEMSDYIMSDKAGVFSALKEINIFNQVYLERGAVTWPKEIDLAPDAMYDEIKGNSKWIMK